MQTKDFFDLVLPAEGWRCAATPFSSGKGMQQFWGQSNQWEADAVLRIDSRGRSAYHACATFKDKDSRAQSNVAFIRSFWLDIDCGEGKHFATVRDGAQALVSFVRATGMPVPLMVRSGYGLHAYWPCTEDMTPEQWKPTAVLLKQACSIAGLHADPSRTADASSVLRPPGTHNRKRGGERKVVVVQDNRARHNSATIHNTLTSYIVANGAEINLAPTAKAPNINSDLTAGMEYPPSYADRIADQCEVINLLRTTRGDVDQPTWFYGLGVVAFCEDGAEKGHDWSKGYADYDEGETQAKLDQVLQFKPTTCAKLGECQPDICAMCPLKGTITSPIVLGRGGATVPHPGGLTSSTIQLPSGYDYRPGADGKLALMARGKDDEDGNATWVPFCDTLFYPVSRISTEDYRYALEIEMVVKKNETRKFVIESGVVGGGGTPLLSELASHELVSLPRQQAHMQAYLQRWMDKQRHEAEETKTYNHFGWQGDDFLVGNTLYTKDGPRAALVHGNAQAKAAALHKMGSLDTWKEFVHKGYDHPGQQAWQFILLSAFAAPLFARLKEFGGVTIFAHSDGTGAGKTTGGQVALSAWGDYVGMQQADRAATPNALITLLGTYGNIPVLYDELTNLSNEASSELVYRISQGKSRERLNTQGLLQTNNSNWSTIVLATGNNLLSEKISLHRANSSAEGARMFEFTINKQTAVHTTNEAQIIFDPRKKNYGHAGPLFIDYVIRNLPEVEAMLIAELRSFNEKANITAGERYWAALIASTMTALKICNKLELLRFRPAELMKWIRRELAANRANQEIIATDVTDNIGRILSDLWEGILVTEGEGEGRGPHMVEANVLMEHPPRGKLVGRAIIGRGKGTAKEERDLLVISQSAVREWCNKNGVSMRGVFTDGVAAGWLDPEVKRFQLGKGTRLYSNVSSHVSCWVIYSDKLGEVAPNPSLARLRKLAMVAEAS